MTQLNDAELVQRLKYRQDHTIAECCAYFKTSHSPFERSISIAKAKGLTANTIITDELLILKTKVKLLQKENDAIKLENHTNSEIRKTIYGLSKQIPDPPKWVLTSRGKGLSGVPMTMWSDWHYGEVVNAEEVGGVNTFNKKVANQRIKLLTESVIDLAFNHMTEPDYPGLVVCLGGDMISGNIHEELRDTQGYIQKDLLDLQEQLITALTILANKFGRLFIPCVIGNHGRTTIKPRHKGRAFESYEWNLYHQLERHFKHDKRFQFLIPNETDAYFSVLGHKFLLTHGDTLGVHGGDGIIGALGPIARGAFKVGRSEANIGRAFDTMIIGHWHTYTPRGDAIPVIVNGALKGYDEYARLAMRIPYSRPSQALWFVHEKYGITAQWQVYLDKLRKTDNTWLKFQQRIE